MHDDIFYRNNLFFACLLVSLIVGALSGGIISGILSPARAPLSSNPKGVSFILRETKEESETIRIVQKSLPSVVNIMTSQDILEGLRNSEFPFSPFLPPREKEEVTSGTGFFISSDGMIITNKHVVSLEDADYTVITQDGKQYRALVLAIDPFNDIAILKIATNENMPVLPVGDSGILKVGQTVIAIGNSLGEFQNTVTKGIISGIGRDVRAGDGQGRVITLEGVIQTDAAINPGNSGGPLLNLAGEVIGVNTAVSREGQLIGFAIGIDDVKKTIESVLKNGKIVRPFLGVRYIPITPLFARKNDLKVTYGAMVIRGEDDDSPAVIPSSPADKAGIQENDIILEVNGEKITSQKTLAKILSQFEPGDTVKLKVLQNDEEKILEIKLTEA